MRKASVLIVFASLALFTAACDSTQPLQAGSQTIDLFFDTGTTSGPALALYEVWRDNDDDGVPDTQETVLYNPDGSGNIVVPRFQCDPLASTLPTKTPWFYTGRVRVLRNLSTSQEVIAEATLGDLSMTEYDLTAPSPAPPRAPDPPLYYLNGLVYAAGAREAIVQCEKIPQGLQIPAQNTFGQTGTFSVPLNVGDTILVEIQKSNVPVSLRLGSPLFVTRVLNNGTQVPDSQIVGDLLSDETNKMFFTYTLR